MDTGKRVEVILCRVKSSCEVSMQGVIWHLYARQEKGMIRGDDGSQLPFRKCALNGVEFRRLSPGQRVCYRIQEGWLGKEAVEVRPLPAEQAKA